MEAYENENGDLNFDLREEGYLSQQGCQEQEIDNKGDQDAVDLIGNVLHARFLIVNEVGFIVLLGFKLRHNNVVTACVHSKVGVSI